MSVDKPTAKRKPRKCPLCGSTRMASILYGLPIFSPELERKLGLGKVVLGGCCTPIDGPLWQCADCETQIYKERDTLDTIEGETQYNKRNNS